MEITGHPQAKAAYIWVFVVGTIFSLISSWGESAAALFLPILP